jgi:hypothetical protein
MPGKPRTAARRQTDPLPTLAVEFRQDDSAAPGDLVAALAALLVERARRAAGGQRNEQDKRT